MAIDKEKDGRHQNGDGVIRLPKLFGIRAFIFQESWHLVGHVGSLGHESWERKIHEDSNGCLEHSRTLWSGGMCPAS